MIVIGRVVSERPDSYVGKKGPVNQQLVTVVDQDPSGERMVQLFEYGLLPEEMHYAGKLQDKDIQLAVRSLAPFGSLFRVRGKIVSVPSLAPAKAPGGNGK